MIVGLILDKNGSVKGTILAKELLSPQVQSGDRYQPHQDVGEVIGNEKSPSTGKPYLQLTEGRTVVGPDESISFKGRDFKAGSAIEIFLDGYLAQGLTVSDNGTFIVTMLAPREFGLHRVTVLDQSTRVNIDGANFVVGPRDQDEESPAPQP
jgi:hypothetical protein